MMDWGFVVVGAILVGQCVALLVLIRIVMRQGQRLQIESAAITVLAREVGKLEQRMQGGPPRNAWDRWCELRAGSELAAKVQPDR